MANNRFIGKGVFYQQVADSKEEAIKSKAYSCLCCVEKGLNKDMECSRCEIAVAHEITIAAFDAVKELRKLKKEGKVEINEVSTKEQA